MKSPFVDGHVLKATGFGWFWGTPHWDKHQADGGHLPRCASAGVWLHGLASAVAAANAKLAAPCGKWETRCTLVN